MKSKNKTPGTINLMDDFPTTLTKQEAEKFFSFMEDRCGVMMFNYVGRLEESADSKDISEASKYGRARGYRAALMEIMYNLAIKAEIVVPNKQTVSEKSEGSEKDKPLLNL